MRRKKRWLSSQVPQVSQQEPALEEAGDCKIALPTLYGQVSLVRHYPLMC